MVVWNVVVDHLGLVAGRHSLTTLQVLQRGIDLVFGKITEDVKALQVGQGLERSADVVDVGVQEADDFLLMALCTFCAESEYLDLDVHNTSSKHPLSVLSLRVGLRHSVHQRHDCGSPLGLPQFELSVCVVFVVKGGNSFAELIVQYTMVYCDGERLNDL